MRSRYTGWRISLVVLALPFIGWVVQACVDHSLAALGDLWWVIIPGALPAIVLLSAFGLTFWVEHIESKDDCEARKQRLRERAAQRDELGEV